jgi:hypothetical protein
MAAPSGTVHDDLGEQAMLSALQESWRSVAAGSKSRDLLARR